MSTDNDAEASLSSPVQAGDFGNYPMDDEEDASEEEMEFNPEEERAKVSKEQHNASLTLSHLADAALMSEQ